MCEKSQDLVLTNHKYRLRLNFIFFLLIIISNSSLAYYKSENNRKIIDALIQNGYENVRIKSDSNKIIIAYENRVYRFEVFAIKKVIEIIVPLIDDGEDIILIPLNKKIPIVSIAAKIQDCRNYCSGKINGEEFSQRLNIQFNTDNVMREVENETEFNSSNFRFDLVVKPLIKFEFGPYSHPILSQINLAPEIKTSWWKGMNLDYELIFPIYNEFGEREDSVRTGNVTLNQVLRLPNSVFVSTSLGVFTQNRYGFDFEAKKYFLNGDISVGCNIGCTSFISFSGLKKMFYSDAFIWTGSASLDYRVEKYDLTLGMMVGKFLLGDESIRFDINREFGEIEIGFFVIRSKDGNSNGGINITVPLFTSKFWNPNVIRIRPAESYSFGYVVKSNTYDLIGLRYNTGNRLDHFTKKLNPSFIRNIFIKNY